MRTWWRALMAEPSVTGPTRPLTADWVVFATCVVVGVVELIARDDLVFRPLTITFGALAFVVVLFRRVHPAAMFFVGFGATVVVSIVAERRDPEWSELYSTVAMLLLPYSLFRQASGRAVAVGSVVMAALVVSIVVSDSETVGDAIAGAVVFLLPAVTGVAVRFRAAARERQVEQARMTEREQLAREVHDSVAHHVAAIVVQAQAAQITASSDPQSAVDALGRIETTAANSLDELRSMVRSLRTGNEPALAPGVTLDAIDALAENVPDHIAVDVIRRGDLTGLSTSLHAALFRVAQESVTNVVRHARGATAAKVEIDGNIDHVRLSISDDGGWAAPRSSSGFGLVGMAERVELLGGSFHAGPAPGGGWRVVASIPYGDDGGGDR